MLPLSGDILQSVIPNVSFIQFCNLLIINYQIILLRIVIHIIL